jgi:hypothetical protein
VQAAVEQVTADIPVPPVADVTGLEIAVYGFAMFAFGRSPVTPPAAVLARLIVEKFISDVNSDPPLRSTLKKWDVSARIVSTPDVGVTEDPPSLNAPHPDKPLHAVGAEDPTLRPLVAVSVVKAPLFGVTKPIAPGAAHGTMPTASSPEDSCGMSLPVVPMAMPPVMVDEVPKIATYPVVPPETIVAGGGQFVPVTRHTALPPMVVAAASAVVLEDDSVVKAPELGVVLPIVPGVAHGTVNVVQLAPADVPPLVRNWPDVPMFPLASYAIALKVSVQLSTS